MPTSRYTTTFHPKPLALRCALLVLASLAFGFLFNNLSPKGITWLDNYQIKVHLDAAKAGATELTLDQVNAALNPASGFLIFDARPLPDYDQGHIPGAISAPSREMPQSLEIIRAATPRSGKVLLYCSSAHCTDSINLAKALKDDGFTQIYVFLPGFEAWKAANQQIEK
jgi:rhodanese-related sulfurtransferase